LELASKPCEVAPVLVVDHVVRFVDEGVSSPDYAIEHFEITTARKRGTHVERLVKPTKHTKHIAPERHVSSSPKETRSTRVYRVSRQICTVANLLKALSESTSRLENDLSLGVEREGENKAREGPSSGFSLHASASPTSHSESTTTSSSRKARRSLLASSKALLRAKFKPAKGSMM
jgi:hypothetical protein